MVASTSSLSKKEDGGESFLMQDGLSGQARGAEPRMRAQKRRENLKERKCHHYFRIEITGRLRRDYVRE